MAYIEILDCTLRDGGYTNNWSFDNNQILDLIKDLDSLGIENIECGYLTSNGKKANSTKFLDFSVFNELIKDQKTNAKLFLMIDYASFDLNNLPNKNSENNLAGIRYAFHKKDLHNIFSDLKQIKEKGYKLFLQPMNTIGYSEKELSELIEKINHLNIDFFYIVDSIGNIFPSELKKLYLIINQYLNSNIGIGFHPHNNIQSAYLCSIELLSISEKRNLIIDASLTGIGRGTGNLSTETILYYLNKKLIKNYDLPKVFHLSEYFINNFHKNNSYKEILGYFLSASNEIHPSYASFLLDKISLEKMNILFENFDENQKAYFNKEYANKLLESFI